MISIMRYIDEMQSKPDGGGQGKTGDLLSATVGAYCAALDEMGNCSMDVCPAVGEDLKQGLRKLEARLGAKVSLEIIAETETDVHEQFQGWSRSTALHNRQQASEVKEILLVMARTAEAVGDRDQRCAAQIDEVTARLNGIANLEDLTEIRESIKKSASELKSSIDRIAAEGKAAIDHLRAEVSVYQTKLEKAEEIASRDSLTGLGSRFWVEDQIERSFHADAPFCAAIIDINEFKRVNDEHGHMVGDELLKQFSSEMRSACRSTDIIGRWGGDEFMLLLNNSRMEEATAQIDRLRKWMCGDYTVQGTCGVIKLCVNASIGLAERQPGETMKELLDRADAKMYEQKAASRANRNSPAR